MPQYTVRRMHIGKTAQLDALAHAAGQVYSRTLVFFWRTVHKQEIWLKPKHLMRLIPTDPENLLHAHSVDAAVQSFFAGLASWRERRKTDPTSKPPRRRKWYFKVEYKRSAMQLKEGALRLSNGRGNDPLLLPWDYPLPQTVVIHWTGEQYEALATYTLYGPEEPEDFSRQDERVAGIDLDEVHIAVSHDGEHTHILNGRLLRNKRQAPSMVSRPHPSSAHLQGCAARDAGDAARRTLYESDLPGVWILQEKQSHRTKLCLREVWLSWASRWRRSHEHLFYASWRIWEPPRSRGHGTPHGHTVLAACPRSSWATARKRLYRQRYRSHSALADVECHRNPIVLYTAKRLYSDLIVHKKEKERRGSIYESATR